MTSSKPPIEVLFQLPEVVIPLLFSKELRDPLRNFLMSVLEEEHLLS
jgi:hypothetical protein